MDDSSFAKLLILVSLKSQAEKYRSLIYYERKHYSMANKPD
jgi:hypothetical protein